MADFNQIILWLVPSEPTSSDLFTRSLQNLTIEAFDLNFGDSKLGSSLGTAKGLADFHPLLPPKHGHPQVFDNRVDINQTSIIQHYTDADIVIDAGLSPVHVKERILNSVAVAVIFVDPAIVGDPPEFPNKSSYDIRLVIKRGTLDIIDRTLEYNVKVTKAPLAKDQTKYFDNVLFPVSAYVTLPPFEVGSDPNRAPVDMPANGQPPKFNELVIAINKVLAMDPGSKDLVSLSNPLTAAQSLHIAYEIVWDRTLFPMPVPESPRTLAEMYTRPVKVQDQNNNQDKAEQDRKKFEAQLTAYHATHEAEAGRLAGYIFSASAAVTCERLSTTAAKAGLTFPLLPVSPDAKAIPEATVILILPNKPIPPLPPILPDPHFIIPAAFYYALGAKLPSQVSAQQRFDMARSATESDLLNEFQTAVDSDTITSRPAPGSKTLEAFAGALTVTEPAINANQAARRLRALGSITGTAPQVDLAPTVIPLVQDWLNYTDTSLNIDDLFWNVKVGPQSAAYLQLVLEGITENYQNLIVAIPNTIKTVTNLFNIQDTQWLAFFLKDPPFPPVTPPSPDFQPPLNLSAPRTSLLPPFTLPGTPTERSEAFIRHLKKFFAMPVSKIAADTVHLATPPLLEKFADKFAEFAGNYQSHAHTVFTFASAPDQAALQLSLEDVFPGDNSAQDWLQKAIQIISYLHQITDIGEVELQFSLMESLYARGFTDAGTVQELSQADFQDALIGTVAYDKADAIYNKSNAVGPQPNRAPAGFNPINPDGTLSNCVPPAYLSPFGPVEYLHELLLVAAASTCENPLAIERDGTIGKFLSSRRGALGDLAATRANLETPLPLIDLVNENLEALAAGLPDGTSGAVYNTSGDLLAGHKLRSSGSKDFSGDQPFAHDPLTLFSAIPEHSSPATPVAKLAAYDKLKVDFTTPDLPYPQALDINRSYLHQLGTSRFSTMRHFRKEITEFAIDASQEPSDFQRHLWRFPVRLDTAREYLHISEDEYALLYSQDLVDVVTQGRLLLREVFGFPNDSVNDVSWPQVVSQVSEFLTRTGLTYCQFIELWQAKYVLFSQAGEVPDFPDCQPCCPGNLTITFLQPQDPQVALRKLAVFIRLWRRLQEQPGPRISFAQLCDICNVLGLFDNNNTINPDFIRQLAALQMLRDWLRLPLVNDSPVAPGAAGVARTQLLALWAGPGSIEWDWALSLLLDHLEDLTEANSKRKQHGPELTKLTTDNLDSLSRLAGFDPGTSTDTWFTHPTSTLRFAEILYKICASDFSIGEILFLFTTSDHLEGDDPFKLPDPNEILDDPFELPDEEEKFGLWALRHKLLGVHVDEEAAENWGWLRIENMLRNEFGFETQPGEPDPLNVLGEHFFPSVLERHGHPVNVLARQFRTDLPSASTAPLMWNNPPDGPFHYDPAAQQLWVQLP